LVGGDLDPARAAVVGAIHAAATAAARRRAAVTDRHLDVEPRRLAWRDRDVELDGVGGKPRGELAPRGAAVGRLGQAAAGSLEVVAVLGGAEPRFPQRRVDDLGVLGIDLDVPGSRVDVLVQHALPGLSTVEGAEHAALLAGAERMAADGGEHAAGVG